MPPAVKSSNRISAVPRELLSSEKDRAILGFWRRMIEHAVQDAVRTHHGLPTDIAIAQRWWIEDHRPAKEHLLEYERSFACCCEWLGSDADAERIRLLEYIDAALAEAARKYASSYSKLRRKAVLSCAGLVRQPKKPKAWRAKPMQYELPLVSAADYEVVKGIDHPDPKWAMKHVPAA